MIILDTDHVNILQHPNAQSRILTANLNASPDQVFVTTIVTVEEQMRGWLALIHRSSDAQRQLPAYERLMAMLNFFAQWQILPFDQAAANEFRNLRQQKIRIATMDLKIASVALTRNALLLSANLRDFQQVPGLRVENWLI